MSGRPQHDFQFGLQQDLHHGLWSAQTPWHRIESVRQRRVQPPGWDDEASGPVEHDEVRVLTACRPEHGWPQYWAWLPVRWQSDGRLAALQDDRPLLEQLKLQTFERCGVALHEHDVPRAPGDALRQTLPADWFAPEADGLLCLFIYAHARSSSREDDRSTPGLEAALQSALDQDPQWLRHAVLPLPAKDPSEAASGLCFILAACQYPPGLLDAPQGAEFDATRAGPADASMARMVAACRETALGRQASLLLLAGDQIYADASGGLADAGNSVERYHKPYQHFKAGPVRQLPYSLARIVHAPDDHEIVDNWEPRVNGPDGNEVERGPYFESAVAAAWSARWEPGDREGLRQHFWHRFHWRGAAFFVADTRTERQPRPLRAVASARIMSEAQHAALAQWLQDEATRPRFVLSGSMCLPRRVSSREHLASALHSDAWDGFPASLQAVLGAVWAAQRSGVVFLSGDEHRSGYVSACLESLDAAGQVQGSPVRFHSIHSSALYAPWPFAVTAAEDFAAPEVFELPGPAGERLRCTVSAWADHPGDGFALLRLHAGQLQVWFDRRGQIMSEHGDAGGPAVSIDMA